MAYTNDPSIIRSLNDRNIVQDFDTPLSDLTNPIPSADLAKKISDKLDGVDETLAGTITRLDGRIDDEEERRESDDGYLSCQLSALQKEVSDHETNAVISHSMVIGHNAENPGNSYDTFVFNGRDPIYQSKGVGTFCVNPREGLSGFFFGDESAAKVLDDRSAADRNYTDEKITAVRETLDDHQDQMDQIRANHEVLNGRVDAAEDRLDGHDDDIENILDRVEGAVTYLGHINIDITSTLPHVNLSTLLSGSVADDRVRGFKNGYMWDVKISRSDIYEDDGSEEALKYITADGVKLGNHDFVIVHDHAISGDMILPFDKLTPEKVSIIDANDENVVYKNELNQEIADRVAAVAEEARLREEAVLAEANARSDADRFLSATISNDISAAIDFLSAEAERLSGFLSDTIQLSVDNLVADEGFLSSEIERLSTFLSDEIQSEITIRSGETSFLSSEAERLSTFLSDTIQLSVDNLVAEDERLDKTLTEVKEGLIGSMTYRGHITVGDELSDMALSNLILGYLDANIAMLGYEDVDASTTLQNGEIYWITYREGTTSEQLSTLDNVVLDNKDYIVIHNKAKADVAISALCRETIDIVSKFDDNLVTEPDLISGEKEFAGKYIKTPSLSANSISASNFDKVLDVANSKNLKAWLDEKTDLTLLNDISTIINGDIDYLLNEIDNCKTFLNSHDDRIETIEDTLSGSLSTTIDNLSTDLSLAIDYLSGRIDTETEALSGNDEYLSSAIDSNDNDISYLSGAVDTKVAKAGDTMTGVLKTPGVRISTPSDPLVEPNTNQMAIAYRLVRIGTAEGYNYSLFLPTPTEHGQTDGFALSSNVKSIADNLANEVTARDNADTFLSGKINTEVTTRGDADTFLSGKIDSEVTTRGDADTFLSGKIDNNKIDISYLSGRIDSEATVRGNADDYLSGAINHCELSIGNLDTELKDLENEVDSVKFLTGSIAEETSKKIRVNDDYINEFVVHKFDTVDEYEDYVNATGGELSSDIYLVKGAFGKSVQTAALQLKNELSALSANGADGWTLDNVADILFRVLSAMA